MQKMKPRFTTYLLMPMPHNPITTTLHGVFLDVLGIGVLLRGDSGIGKSELALSLVNRGHRLIADDAVDFTKIDADTIMGSCPELLQDFLEVRGLGILNIRVMYGDSAIKNNKRLQLIVKVAIFPNEELTKIDRLHGVYKEQNILDVNIPQVTIPIAPGRNLSVLIESAVRNQILKNTGYNASEDFINRQHNLLNKNHER